MGCEPGNIICIIAKNSHLVAPIGTFYCFFLPFLKSFLIQNDKTLKLFQFHFNTTVFASLCIACPVNSLDALFSRMEFLHMFSITKPKVVFCDADVYDLVRECLSELENNASVFTFGGTTDDSIPVEQLFEQTPEENEFS